MKLAIDQINMLWLGSMMLCEVESEAEAFAEIRRFLKVNNFAETYMGYSLFKEKEMFGTVHAEHKQIGIGCVRERAHLPKDKTYAVVFFGLYDGDNTPAKTLKGKEELYQLEIKKDEQGEIVYHTEYNRPMPMYVSRYYQNQDIEWYAMVKTYAQDLERRRQGG